MAFSTNFCPIKTDLSGNTVWPQASGFQKLVKMDNFFGILIHSIFCDFQTPCKAFNVRTLKKLNPIFSISS